MKLITVSLEYDPAFGRCFRAGSEYESTMELLLTEVGSLEVFGRCLTFLNQVQIGPNLKLQTLVSDLSKLPTLLTVPEAYAHFFDPNGAMVNETIGTRFLYRSYVFPPWTKWSLNEFHARCCTYMCVVVGIVKKGNWKESHLCAAPTVAKLRVYVYVYTLKYAPDTLINDNAMDMVSICLRPPRSLTVGPINWPRQAATHLHRS